MMKHTTTELGKSSCPSCADVNSIAPKSKILGDAVFKGGILVPNDRPMGYDSHGNVDSGGKRNLAMDSLLANQQSEIKDFLNGRNLKPRKYTPEEALHEGFRQALGLGAVAIGHEIGKTMGRDKKEVNRYARQLLVDFPEQEKNQIISTMWKLAGFSAMTTQPKKVKGDCRYIIKFIIFHPFWEPTCVPDVKNDNPCMLPDVCYPDLRCKGTCVCTNLMESMARFCTLLLVLGLAAVAVAVVVSTPGVPQTLLALSSANLALLMKSFRNGGPVAVEKTWLEIFGEAIPLWFWDWLYGGPREEPCPKPQI